VSSDVVRGDLRFVGSSRIFLLGILIFKGLTARRLYKSFGVKGLIGLYFGSSEREGVYSIPEACFLTNNVCDVTHLHDAVCVSCISRVCVCVCV
jgi:hypothetical protein